MSWTTRELAVLAGTSRRTVRHYHDVGLLEEPERGTNGYRLYKVTHLLRLLRIRRLTDLGLTLPQIRGIDTDDVHPATALRTLDAELAATVERLQSVRDELAIILTESAPTDLPVHLAAATDGLSAADRALTVVLSRVLSPAATEAWRDLLGPYRSNPAVDAFNHLPADADEATRAEVAAQLASHMRSLANHLPDLIGVVQAEMARDSGRRPPAVDIALRQLYNPAQFDVLRRLRQQPTNR